MGGKVTVSLKPHLADFCRHEFGLKNNEIQINRNHEIGKFISSLILVSEFPRKPRQFEYPVEFILPSTPFLDFDKNFIYISAWGEQRLQDYLQALFDLRMQLFFFVGYQKNYEQKQIIEGVMRGYNIRHSSLSYEQIKKNDYRKRVRTELSVFQDIQSAMV